MKLQWGSVAVIKCCNGVEDFYRGTQYFDHLQLFDRYTELMFTVSICPKRPWVASASGRRHTLLCLLFPFWSRMVTGGCRHQEGVGNYMLAGIAFNE